jgi:hypothetical protein
MPQTRQGRLRESWILEEKSEEKSKAQGSRAKVENQDGVRNCGERGRGLFALGRHVYGDGEF